MDRSSARMELTSNRLGGLRRSRYAAVVVASAAAAALAIRSVTCAGFSRVM